MKLSPRLAVKFWIGAAFLCSAWGFASETAKVYSITGQVIELRPDRVVVDSAGQKFEFQHEHALQLPEKVKLGDRITVWYKLDAQKVEAGPRQEAGEALPKPTPIIDDRAFYPA